MIELKNVTKTFGAKGRDVHAVRDVSLQVQDGEIFGIIGFSGAGKSTLVRCINLLERPTSGSVLIDGTDITKLPERELREVRKKIGMIFQHFNLMRSRTVYGNIDFPLKKSGLSREAYLRHLISGVVPRDAPPPDYYSMMRELHRIGNNLNQIAQKAHTLNVIDVQRYDRDMRMFEDTVKKITEAVILPEPMKNENRRGV